MKRVAVRDTKPERLLREACRRAGLLGYRVDHPLPLDGVRRKSDMTFARARVCVFVDGCYWHGCAEHFKPSGRNVDWWRAKIARTRARDAHTDELLRAAGWESFRVWEHEDMGEAAERLAELVRDRRLG
jgi:DNA mismatch endonuclease (patch repair protein)